MPTTTPPPAQPPAVSASAVTWVDCPACRRPAEYAPHNPYRPFCSRLCRATDLGRWAQEEFRVQAPTEPGDDFQ